jgi:hypothetical protein
VIARRTDALLAGEPIPATPASIRTTARMAREFGLPESAWSDPLTSKQELMEAIFQQGAGESAPRFVVGGINADGTCGHFFNAAIDASGDIRFIDGALPADAAYLRRWDLYTILKTSGVAK